jgi:hypothetical protein
MLCAPTTAIDITPRLNGEVFFLSTSFEAAELAQICLCTSEPGTKHNLLSNLVRYTCLARKKKRNAGANKHLGFRYLILREAFYTVTNVKDQPWKFGDLEILATNSRLHKELLTLKQIFDQRER